MMQFKIDIIFKIGNVTSTNIYLHNTILSYLVNNDEYCVHGGDLDYIRYLYNNKYVFTLQSCVEILLNRFFNIARFLYNKTVLIVPVYNEFFVDTIQLTKCYDHNTILCVYIQNRIDCIDFLYSLGIRCTKATIYYILGNAYDNWKLLKYIYLEYEKSLFINEFSKCLLEIISDRNITNNVSMFKFFYNQKFNCSQMCANYICRSGNIELLVMLINDNIWPNYHGANYAVGHGYLSILKMLYRKGIRCSAIAGKWAIRYAHLHIIKFLLQNGYNFKPYHIRIATYYNNQNVLNLIMNYKNDDIYLLLVSLFMNKNLICLQIFRQNVYVNML
jgi:hypothetical protein